MTPGLTIRRAAAGDAGRLTAIAREAKASWGYPARWLSAWESSLRIPPDYIRRQTVFVCEEGQDMIGFCALEDRDGTWHLEHLWVDPRRHGIGAGRLLFERAAAWIGQVRPGRLMVESDPNAAGFYARLGARRTGWVAAPVEGAQDRRLPVLEWEIAPPKQPTSSNPHHEECAMQMPKPGPGHAVLERLSGTWEGEEKMHPSPWDPEGGIATGRTKSHLTLNGFALITDYEQERDGAISFTGHGVWTFDPTRDLCVLHWFDCMGSPPEVFEGRFEGDTLTISHAGPMHAKFTYEFMGRDSMRTRMEMSEDGRNWKRMFDGTYRRA